MHRTRKKKKGQEKGKGSKEGKGRAERKEEGAGTESRLERIRAMKSNNISRAERARRRENKKENVTHKRERKQKVTVQQPNR